MGNDTTVFCCVPTAKRKTHTKMAWEFGNRKGAGSTKLAGHLPDRVSLLHKGSLHYAQRVRKTSSRTKSFVCQTTPHFDNTSREAPTLFVPIIHDTTPNVNPFFRIFLDLL